MNELMIYYINKPNGCRLVITEGLQTDAVKASLVSGEAISSYEPLASYIGGEISFLKTQSVNTKAKIPQREASSGKASSK